jgi:hypothetical protein
MKHIQSLEDKIKGTFESFVLFEYITIITKEMRL